MLSGCGVLVLRSSRIRALKGEVLGDLGPSVVIEHGPLRTPERLRERAAYCRAMAEGQVTAADAPRWHQLAARWERLAYHVERARLELLSQAKPDDPA